MTFQVPKSCMGVNGAPCKFPPFTSMNGTYRCDQCKAARTTKGMRSAREVATDRMYNSDWRRLKANLISLGNGYCQRVIDGVRCRNVGKIHHHVVEAMTDPRLFYEPLNIVFVCDEHHPRPNEENQGEYVPTLWRQPMGTEAVPDTVIPPGGLVPRGFHLWNREERRKFFAARNE